MINKDDLIDLISSELQRFFNNFAHEFVVLSSGAMIV